MRLSRLPPTILMSAVVLALLASVAVSSLQVSPDSAVRGTVSVDPSTADAWHNSTLVVRAYLNVVAQDPECAGSSCTDLPVPLQYWDIYNSDDAAAQSKIPFVESTCQLRGSGDTKVACSFSFPALARGRWYSFIAFADGDNNRRLDLPREPVGWWSGGQKGEHGWGIKPLLLNSTEGPGPLDFAVAENLALPVGPLYAGTHGLLHQVRGHAVLELRGTNFERGHAHGFLLARQIVHFFRLVTLVEFTDSRSHYVDIVVPFVNQAFKYSKGWTDSIDGVMQGILDSKVDPFVPELGRNFSRSDLLALNVYGAWPSPAQRQSHRKGRKCSQFIAWGRQTAGTDVAGGTITGRNMDGEIDFRRITVTNFLIYAVTPSLAEDGLNASRYVHFMWPGFVGSSSGFNERGVYVMMNDGMSHPSGPPMSGSTPDDWSQREVLAKAQSLRDVPEIFSLHRGDQGGLCGDGCNFVLAQPTSRGGEAGMIYESDRFGGGFRHAGEAAPTVAEAIMATNHFLKYGYNPLQPRLTFGVDPGFSSLWRYESGKRTLEAWGAVTSPSRRLSANAQNFSSSLHLGTDRMHELLQRVTEGATEHSIVFRPDQLTFDVAVAQASAGGWNAAYGKWTKYEFEELFQERGEVLML